MGGATEAPEKQTGPHSYSFYYHSLVTCHNNAGHFISINLSAGDIHLSICKPYVLTLLLFMGHPCTFVVLLLCVCTHTTLCTSCVFIHYHCLLGIHTVRPYSRYFSVCVLWPLKVGSSGQRQICLLAVLSPTYSGTSVLMSTTFLF